MGKLEDLRQDLRKGYTLEEALVKNNTNLQEVFKNINRYPVTRRKPKHNAPVKDEWRNIQPTKSYTYRISKMVNGRQEKFGTYKIFEEAKMVRDYLEDNAWNRELLEDFIIKHNIKRTQKRLKK